MQIKLLWPVIDSDFSTNKWHGGEKGEGKFLLIKIDQRDISTTSMWPWLDPDSNKPMVKRHVWGHCGKVNTNILDDINKLLLLFLRW